MTSLDCLPFELVDRILAQTDGLTLIRCCQVSKSLNQYVIENEALWREIVRKEFKLSSIIAKRKCGNDLSWFHLYRNLRMWAKLSSCRYTVSKFYSFSMHDKCHALEIDYSVLPLRESNGIILYDMNNMKYIPVAVPTTNCLKISHTDHVTVIQQKSSVLVQRSVDDKKKDTEASYKADKFILNNHEMYYANNRDVYKVDLKSVHFSPILLLHCDYDIREIQYSEGVLHIFTDCGKIVSVNDRNETKLRSIQCPEPWLQWIKHVCPIDDRNYICYSRNLFQVEMGNSHRLYLHFPRITALFFYGDVIIVGTKAGEILLYRMSKQKSGSKPIFEKIAVIPEGKYAVSLDVYERKSGPVIVAATFFDLFLIDVHFYPEEQDNTTSRRPDVTNRLSLYKRLLKLRDRIKRSNIVL